MIAIEILIVIVASAAIVAAVGGLVYMLVLAGLEERDRHLHKLANARARHGRTQAQLSQSATVVSRPILAGRSGH